MSYMKERRHYYGVKTAANHKCSLLGCTKKHVGGSPFCAVHVLRKTVRGVVARLPHTRPDPKWSPAP